MSELQVQVLGPLVLLGPGRAAPLGGPKERDVLAILAARAGITLSTALIAEQLWCGAPPRTAERTVQSYVARIRRALEEAGADAGAIATDGRGYRLAVDPEDLDARRFEVVAARGRDELRTGDARARETLRAALALWTGEAFAAHLHIEVCLAESRRLEEMRLLTVEARIDADLAAGVDEQLVPELEAMVLEHPFRERVWAQLMTALYRGGRQRDALAVFERARRLFAEEIGVAPGPELQTLERSILTHDPALAPAPRLTTPAHDRMPSALDTTGMPLVGRADALHVLRAAWSRAAGGQGGMVSVRGPVGIGKTRLVAELASQVHADGALVLYGRCDHSFRGARDLLRTVLRGIDVTLSAFGERVPAEAADAGLAASFVDLLREHTSSPALVVLDDLHLADGPTLEFVAELAGWAAAAPMLLVAVFRVEPGPGAGAVAPPVPASASQIELTGLERSEVAAICASYDDAWTVADVEDIVAATHGVPLLVHEIAATEARERTSDRVADVTRRMTSARAQLATMHGEITDGVEDIRRLAERRRHLVARPSTDDGDPPSCPYKGLAAFDTADAAHFFGRERLVAELVARLPGTSLLGVIGTSGVGKSSLLRAGLIPALAGGGLPGSERWDVRLVTPTAVPAEITAPDGSPVLVVVDQFEEVFGLPDDERRAVITAVLAASRREHTTVVVAMRADFVDRCSAHPGLGRALSEQTVIVGPMTTEELRRAIQLPARAAGLELEAGLTELVVADVRGNLTSALPLMSTALAETWERRVGRTLTILGYHSAGGVAGAVARLAEDAYSALPPSSRPVARRLLLRLCDAGEDGTVDVRRRARRDELGGPDDHETSSVIEHFLARRLVTVDDDVVEVAHEALLREWPRLRAWLEDDAQSSRVRRRLTAGARGWLAADRDDSELVRGAALAACVEWSAGRAHDLTPIERSFLAASLAESERELRDAERRVQERARSNRRLRALLAAAVATVVIAATAGAIAVHQRSRADEQTQRALENAVAHDGERLGAQALLQEDLDLALLLAVQAVTIQDSPETRASLWEALQRSPRAVRVMRSNGPRLLGLDVDPTGRTIAVAENEGGVTLLDASTGESLGHLDGAEGLRTVAWSPDGRLVASVAGAADADGPYEVRLVDFQTRQVVGRLSGITGARPPASLAFSDDGRFLATVTFDPEAEPGPGEVLVWDMRAPGAPMTRVELADVHGGGTVSFNADASAIIVPTADGSAAFDVATGARLPHLLLGHLPVFGPDRAVAATLPEPFSEDVTLVDVATGEILHRLERHASQVLGVAFSPDGRLVATVGDDRLALVWDVATGRLLHRLEGHAGRVLGVDFGPGGRTLYTTGLDRAVIAWDLAGDRGVIQRLDDPTVPLVAPPGFFGSPILLSPTADRRIFTAGEDEVHALNLTGGGHTVIDTGHGTAWVAVSTPDGAAVITAGDDGTMRRWDLATGSMEAEQSGATDGYWPLDVSPDGTRLAAQVGDTAVQLFDARTLDPMGDVVDPGGATIYLGAFDRRGEWLAVSTFDSAVLRLDLATGVTERGTAGEPGMVLAWSIDGRTLLGGAGNGAFVRLDPETLERLGPSVIAHDGPVTSIRVDPWNGTVATTSTDGTVALWDAGSGARLGVVDLGHPNDDVDARFVAPDVLVLAYTSGAAYRVDLQVDRLLGAACRVAGRTLTADEFRQFVPDRNSPPACAPDASGIAR